MQSPTSARGQSRGRTRLSVYPWPLRKTMTDSLDEGGPGLVEIPELLEDEKNSVNGGRAGTAEKHVVN